MSAFIFGHPAPALSLIRGRLDEVPEKSDCMVEE
jgi:hypothetical protein